MAPLITQPLIDPLLRTLMGMPPSLLRFAPQSQSLHLETRYLRDSPLLAGQGQALDDSCLITAPQGQHEQLGHIRLVLGQPPERLRDIHLCLLHRSGSLQIVLGGPQIRLFTGAGGVLAGSLQLASRPSCFIGDGCSLQQARLVVANGDLVLGDDCHVSDEAQLLCHQQFALLDQHSGQPVVPGRASISLGRHVWLGRRSLLLPGAQIGEGAVVEAGSVLRGPVPAHAWVGTGPAQLLQQGVSWQRPGV